MVLPELYNLAPSPWSLRARWALHHHGIKYTKHDYQPFAGELFLRWRLWEWWGRVSVPILVAPSGTLRDSVDIAQWADDHSALPGASPLFPAAKLADILRFTSQCSKTLEYDRGTFLDGALAVPSLKRLFLPKAAIDLLGRRIVELLGTLIITLFSRKWRGVSQATTKQEAEAWLVQCKEHLEPGTYALGTFTYADVAAAVMIEQLHTTDTVATRAVGKSGGLPGDVSHLVNDSLVQYCEWIYDKHFPAECPRIQKMPMPTP